MFVRFRLSCPACSPLALAVSSFGHYSALPPPDIRAVIDKMALYVARNGEAFAKGVWENKKDDPRFAFLLPWSPLHAYYMECVGAARASAAATQDPAPASAHAPPAVSDPLVTGISTATPPVPPATEKVRSEMVGNSVLCRDSANAILGSTLWLWSSICERAG